MIPLKLSSALKCPFNVLKLQIRFQFFLKRVNHPLLSVLLPPHLDAQGRVWRDERWVMNEEAWVLLLGPAQPWSPAETVVLPLNFPEALVLLLSWLRSSFYSHPSGAVDIT